MLIQKLISSFFICLLALSITPRIILHNLVANHRDGGFSTPNSKQTEVSKAGFNCHFDDLVAESPFIATEEIQVAPPLLSFKLLIQFSKISFFSRHHFYAELRGPPSC